MIQRLFTKLTWLFIWQYSSPVVVSSYDQEQVEGGWRDCTFAAGVTSSKLPVHQTLHSLGDESFTEPQERIFYGNRQDTADTKIESIGLPILSQ